MTALRWICLILWAAAAISLAPGAFRYARGRYEARDEFRTALFFTALVMIGGMIRWLFAADSLPSLAGVHALTAALAAYVLVIVHQNRGK